MQKNFRPVAVPLFTSDPYFSVWSFADRLTDDHTRHWTGHRQSMCGILTVDGVHFRFMGKSNVTDTYIPEGKALEQISLEVTPTATIYTFSHPACDLKITFLSPLLMDRLEILSRPVCYLFYEITPKEEGHTFEVYVDASAELSGDAREQEFAHGSEEGHVWVGNAEQDVLAKDGDDIRIDWGYLHLVHPNASIETCNWRHHFFKRRKRSSRHYVFEPDQPISYQKFPVLCAVSDKLSDVFVFAYDDIKSILFYGDRQIDAYYKTVYGSFEKMLPIAVGEAEEMRKVCAEFDQKLIADMEKISPEYADIGALAYRQAIAAHKLIEVDGKLQFLSKECFSNGCIATLDVTYPSIPLFLVFNPELVRAMMRPLFTFARDKRWQYPFAPHDCGRYPWCTGQRYGLREGVLTEERQMPVEECGNAILTVAAALRADGNCELLYDNADLLKKWADYLVVYGYDPENQLCTDDFAGHLARNCNLSLKAIVALGAYAQMTGDVRYGEVAKDMASRWVKDAKKQDGKGWRLTFDRDDTWSMKYNIIWDKLLGLNLFDASVYEEEVDVYLSKMNPYGVPLDSRDAYTKLDWMAWTTVMTDRKDYTHAVYKSIARMISESEDRVPITDWYYTDDAKQAGFQARSVLGGFYINLLAEKWK